MQSRGKRWALPPMAGILKRGMLWALTFAFIVGGYGAGKLEPFFEPVELPLTPWDRAIPFVPATAWVYGTITWVSLL
ncbi:MAG: hypothetical protein AAGF12_39905, partial [Myxococcota bacterium]